MALHVFGHVKSQQLYAHDLCELPTDLSLTDTGRARKKERANRLVLFVQARPRQFDCSRLASRLLHSDRRQPSLVAFQILQGCNVRTRDMLRRNPGDTGNNLSMSAAWMKVFPFTRGLQPLVGSRFINHIDCLIRHVAIIDVATGQF